MAKTFRARVIQRAWEKTLQAAMAHMGPSVILLIIITVLTLLITVAAEGSAAAWGEFRTYLIALIANAGAILLVFAWNLWLAPYELVSEEMGEIRDKAMAASQPSARSPEPDLADLAGKVRFIGERYLTAAVDGSDPVYRMYLSDLENSSHHVWVDQEFNRLRRELLLAIHKATQNLLDATAQTAAQDAVNGLSKKLLDAANGV